MGDDRGKQDQRGKQSKDEVVRQCSGKRHGVILCQGANDVDDRVLAVKEPHEGLLYRVAFDS